MKLIRQKNVSSNAKYCCSEYDEMVHNSVFDTSNAFIIQLVREHLQLSHYRHMVTHEN